MGTIPRTSGIYKIVCSSNGKVYVGSAMNLQRRKLDHFKQLRSQTHRNKYLQRAWVKYGADAFEFIVIELVAVPLLVEREQYWMDHLQVCDRRKGFNILPTAASPLGMKYSDEVRRRVSDALRGRPKSETHRQKLSEANQGKKFSASVRQKLSDMRRGVPKSKAHSRNIATAIAERWVVTSPDGTTHNVLCLKWFCEEQGIDYSSMRGVAKGRRKHHRGWRCQLAADHTGALWGHLTTGEQVAIDDMNNGHLSDGRGFVDLKGLVAK